MTRASFKEKLFLDWLSPFFKGLFAGLFGRVIGQLRNLMDELPGRSVKIFWGYCLLIFLVVLVAGGTLFLPLGIVLLVSQMAPESVNSVALAGRLLIWIGCVYIVVPVIILTIVATGIYLSTRKLTDRLQRKLR